LHSFSPPVQILRGYTGCALKDIVKETMTTAHMAPFVWIPDWNIMELDKSGKNFPKRGELIR
jgi:hypothetical protein